MPTPENEYRNAATVPERRRIQAAVIEAYRGRVAALARRMVPAQHWAEAEQVGLIGVLVALGKYDPEKGVPFWAHASLWVRDEIEMWAGRGIYWRPSTKRAPGRTANVVHRTPRSMDAEVADGTEQTLHDRIASSAVTAEDCAVESELRARLDGFLATLPDEDRRLLLCDKRERADGGVEKGNNVRARRYLSLVERAAAHVKGVADVDHRGTSNCDTAAAPAGKP